MNIGATKAFLLRTELDALYTHITFDYLSDVGRAGLVRQMTQNAEYRETGQQTGERVQRRNNGRITVHIVLEAIERRIHNQVAEAHGQREKALRDGRIPNLCANAARASNASNVNQSKLKCGKNTPAMCAVC